MKEVPVEQRIINIESDLQFIKNMLNDIHEILKMALQSHAEEKIMSAKEVADFLDVDINVIYSKCSRGDLPFFKMGKLIKFRKTEIINWRNKLDKKENGSVDDYVNRYLQKNQLRG